MSSWKEYTPSSSDSISFCIPSTCFTVCIPFHHPWCSHVHTRTHVHIHTCTHMCIHTYTCAHIHTRACTHMLSRVHTRSHNTVYIHVRTHSHMCTHIHTHSHMFTHVHTRAHTCAGQWQVLRSSLAPTAGAPMPSAPTGPRRRGGWWR